MGGAAQAKIAASACGQRFKSTRSNRTPREKSSIAVLSPRLLTRVIMDAGPRYASATSERTRPAIGLHASFIGFQFLREVGTFTISP